MIIQLLLQHVEKSMAFLCPIKDSRCYYGLELSLTNVNWSLIIPIIVIATKPLLSGWVEQTTLNSNSCDEG